MAGEYLEAGDVVKDSPHMNQVFLLRCNGALIHVFSTEEKAVGYMRQHRRNGEFWRIEKKDVL